MKDIKGYENLYAVTEDGRVWSYKSEIFLKPRLNKNGYLQVGLWKNRKLKRPYIHRLILETFNPVEGMDKLQCNHRNEIKTDNCLNNLEWVTCKENINYGSHNKRMGDSHNKKALCIDTGVIYESLKSAAEQTGINITSISKCCNDKRRSAGNYHWQYIEVS